MKSLAYSASLWKKTSSALADVPEVLAAIVYADASEQNSLSQAKIPVLQQLAGGELTTRQISSTILSTYFYPDVQSHRFAIPFSESFHYNTEALSHTRNLTFLKPIMAGPYFDLELIWDEHTYYEFSDRSVEHTMSTMVQEPYVNHVPTVS
jgi:carboxymethylenebutenolidase